MNLSLANYKLTKKNHVNTVANKIKSLYIIFNIFISPINFKFKNELTSKKKKKKKAKLAL